MVDVAPQASAPGALSDSLSSLSPQEVANFEQKLKDPKFIELLADYAKDISDPKVKAAQDQYIRQLEEEGRTQEIYGKGMQLVTPTASFVAKTANSKSGQKIFINVCTSDKVEVATSKRERISEGSARQGLMWHIPLMLGPRKEGSDRHKIQCMVFDFIIHPDTCRMALNNASYKAIILDSATDNIEQREGWKLTRQYSFPKLTFKSTPGVDKPSPLSLRQKTEANQLARPQAGNADGGSGRRSASSFNQQSATPLVTELTTSSTVNAAHHSKGNKSSGFKFPASKPKSDAAASRPAASSRTSGRDISVGESDQSLMTAVSTSRSEAVTVNTGAADQAGSADVGERQPQYELVYRGHVDLADSWQDPATTTSAARLPKELVIRIHLPGVQQASQAQLNIEPTQLDLSVPGKYKLQLPLPYRVAEADGSASFNAARSQLEVTLPVLPPKTAHRQSATGASSSQQQQSEAQTSGDVHSDSAQADGQAAQSQAQSVSTNEPTDASGPAAQPDNASNSVSSNSALQERLSGSDASSSGQSTALQAQSQRLTANQQKWAAMHAGSSTESPVSDNLASTAEEQAVNLDALLAAAAAGNSFIPSSGFRQHIQGYVFTTREQGLGYCKDAEMNGQLSMPEEQIAAESDVDKSLCPKSEQKVYHVLKPRLLSCIAAEELD